SFCAEVQPNARLILPFDFTSSNEWLAKNPETSIGPGKITVHGPHQDSWFLHPLNTINVWCAIGSVVSGNGLSIFPQSWSSRPTYSRTPFGAKISADQYLGPAVNFDLDPGDMVVFNAEHVHSSEINQTDLSRFIISMRMTFDEPQYFDAEVYDYRQVSFGSKAKPSLEIERNPRINFYNNHPHFSTSEREIKIPDSKTRCKDIEQLDIKEEENCLTFDSNALAENEIKLVTNAICVTKITGQIYSFSRFCTHEGADLALGQIKNQRVVCPWHNLSFNLDTGKSACKSLRQLRLHPCREHNGSVTLECSTIEALSS
ncbi:MAG: Rieske 2Fe-2S domain-containing protein, partial [Cyanobacteria bacterium J06631_2]